MRSPKCRTVAFLSPISAACIILVTTNVSLLPPFSITPQNHFLPVFRADPTCCLVPDGSLKKEEMEGDEKLWAMSWDKWLGCLLLYWYRGCNGNITNTKWMGVKLEFLLINATDPSWFTCCPEPLPVGKHTA